MTLLTGLSAFPITPADAEGRVDPGALRVLLARLVGSGVDSIGLLGSTGTYAYLSRAERRRALETALDATAGRVPLLVGVGALRTDEAVRLAQDAKGMGAAAGLLAPVSYTPLTDDEVFEHFATVARESGLPLCIYDNPGTTHFRFGPDLVGRLARVPGIVAVKSPAPEPEGVAAHLAALRAAVPEGFPLGYSGDWHAAEALIAGGDAWYSVVAGLFPEAGLAILRAVRAGDAAEARRLDARMRPLWDLFRAFSSLRVVYACADLMGLCHAAPPRPILPLPEAARQRVAGALRALDLS
ncbi:dihydrodipicolinate synthase family protein [Methylobacterium oxalidis]|uniref:Dihydrodipicolinate synthase family protein n=1 Tax=Methylobacterium oxalidis TaxID=944322 RepID=A0A512J4R5_9HYPH|nr:dihydrodipicolinate synthase family protein [Methylobacterium oxalidis]GEP04977.1 dihydrodipicolinate synthase family protein [Methylobacterium oxalidis]GJE32369.1 4-hydroxy-tetrahydrodipicolinate synthase [Methylobacterium oxalidis]GLS63715.1 dihydrodipicolinate synthase family protein [Methylobacterium oxalidis]